MVRFIVLGARERRQTIKCNYTHINTQSEEFKKQLKQLNHNPRAPFAKVAENHAIYYNFRSVRVSPQGRERGWGGVTLYFLAASVASSQLCGCQCDDLATLWTVIRQPAATLSSGSVNYKDAQTLVNLPQVKQKSKQRENKGGREGRLLAT